MLAVHDAKANNFDADDNEDAISIVIIRGAIWVGAQAPPKFGARVPELNLKWGLIR